MHDVGFGKICRRRVRPLHDGHKEAPPKLLDFGPMEEKDASVPFNFYANDFTKQLREVTSMSDCILRTAWADHRNQLFVPCSREIRFESEWDAKTSSAAV